MYSLILCEIIGIPFASQLVWFSRKQLDLSVLVLQQYVLQRDWSSRSCTTMNRIGSTSVPVSFCAPATMTATMSRTHFHHHRPPDNASRTASPAAVISDPPTPCNSVCPITSAPLADHPPPVYDPDLPINSINTITLPNFRNFHKMNTLTSGNAALNPNFPKSISTWGPLHKNFHWKVGQSSLMFLNGAWILFCLFLFDLHEVNILQNGSRFYWI